MALVLVSLGTHSLALWWAPWEPLGPWPWSFPSETALGPGRPYKALKVLIRPSKSLIKPSKVFKTPFKSLIRPFTSLIRTLMGLISLGVSRFCNSHFENEAVLDPVFQNMVASRLRDTKEFFL